MFLMAARRETGTYNETDSRHNSQCVSDNWEWWKTEIRNKEENDIKVRSKNLSRKAHYELVWVS
jgi:hypothetical protein